MADIIDFIIVCAVLFFGFRAFILIGGLFYQTWNDHEPVPRDKDFDDD